MNTGKSIEANQGNIYSFGGYRNLGGLTFERVGGRGGAGEGNAKMCVVRRPQQTGASK